MALKCGLTFTKLLHSRSTSQVVRSSDRGLLMIPRTHVKVRMTLLNQSTKTLEHLEFLVCTALLGNLKRQLAPQILYIFDGIRLGNSFVALAVCFWSLSCQKTHP